MAERQETSVMASIQDILRDAQVREEEEKVAAQRRVQQEEEARAAAIRRQQEEEESRLRSEEADRQRRVYDEQRKVAEIAAMQEATIQRARMEAEAQARLAEMAARQEHERQLKALQHDKSKKTLFRVAVGSGIVLFLALVIGTFALVNSYNKQQRIEAELRELQDQKVAAEQDKARLQNELATTKDPEKIAQLQAQLAEREQKIDNLNKEVGSKGSQRSGGFVGPGPGIKPPPPTGGATKPPCNCSPGDPLCSCL